MVVHVVEQLVAVIISYSSNSGLSVIDRISMLYL